jgi:TolB-like protein
MRGFLEELRYRNVFRVAIAYVVAGWLIAQVADLAADAFNAPDWVMQMLIVLLLIGLPVALFLAWAYELTPDGVKKAKDLPADTPKDPRAGRRLNRITIVALAIAVAWLGWDKLQGPGDEPTTAAITETVDRSIAVLPFDDFSPDSDHAWFADGLTEEILNSLARITDLDVASRTSSFVFRGSAKDVPTIAAELGVAHILEGSVRRAGNQLRVTAQLIRAADDKHLWSDTFDGDIDNSIAIQEEIAVAIGRAMETAMDPEELARMVAAGTRSVEAWEIYLRGLVREGEAYARVDAPTLLEAADIYAEAAAIDPAFVDAQLRIARIWYFQLDISTPNYNREGPPYAERRARHDAAVAKVIEHARTEVDRLRAQYSLAELDVRIKDRLRLAERIAELRPDEPENWTRLMELYEYFGQMEKAREVGLKAWSVDPRMQGKSTIVYHMRRVDLDETLRLIDAGLAKDEVSAYFYYQSHRALLEAGQVERAAELIDKFTLRSVDPESNLMMQLRQACAEGRVADADALLGQVPEGSNTRWLFLMTLGRQDEARELLRQYDTPDYLFILAGFLDYRAFEARDYPLLWKTLRAQGIERPPARPQTFTCQRDA